MGWCYRDVDINPSRRGDASIEMKTGICLKQTLSREMWDVHAGHRTDSENTGVWISITTLIFIDVTVLTIF